MITDGSYPCGEHCIRYTEVESLHCTAETFKTVNYTKKIFLNIYIHMYHETWILTEKATIYSSIFNSISG